MKLLWVILLIIALPLTTLAQTAADLKQDAKTPENVLTLGMGHGLQRYSPLTKISTKNVKQLVPVWTYSLADNKGQESQPLVIDGVMYVTTHNSTIALDSKSGKQIWKTMIEYPEETPRIACCGIVNRGAAAYQGKLYRTTLDAHVIALDMKTGEEVWRSQAIDFKTGYSFTVTPLIANGVVITGISGAEYGIRGFIDGWDPDTGKRLWRRYTVAGPDEPGGDTWPGDTSKHGGGSAWLTGSYDPELDLVYWGVGNAGPWNAEFRKGDNLYTCSVIALRPKTGDIAWHYQFSPNDTYDYDGVNELVQAELDIDGKRRKVIMQANRNGFFYVIDRTNGELLRANAFVKVTWADGIDMKTGRPIESDVSKRVRAGEKVEVWPSAFGGKNWMPMSYNPQTGLVYANTLEHGMTYQLQTPQYRAGAFYFGIDLEQFSWLVPKDGPSAHLSAINPLTGKAKWQVPLDLANFAGTLTTAGNLVFTGRQTGEFMAYDAETGKDLWEFQTGSGVIGQPITWEQDGKQYIAVTSGSGAVYYLFMPLFGAQNTKINELLKSAPPGGSVWVFGLFDQS